jgi:hypothetical protein
MSYVFPSPEFDEHLAALTAQPECATRLPDYPLWVLQQAHETLLAFLDFSGVRITDALCVRLSRWVFAAAVVSKCVAERVGAAQARLMVLALAVNRLLTDGDDLRRVQPVPVWAGTAELDVLMEYCQTGSWKMDLPAEAVEPVRDQVRRLATARLVLADALLVGLLLTVRDWKDAVRVLDVEEEPAKRTLAGAWRRQQLAVLQVVEEHLHAAGRDLPERFGVQ